MRLLQRLYYSPLLAWLAVALLVWLLAGCSSAPEEPEAAAKPKLLLFTQPNCPPCELLKRQLHDPALAEVFPRFDFQEVPLGDGRFELYQVRETPALVGLPPDGTIRRFAIGGTLGELRNWLCGLLEPNIQAIPPQVILAAIEKITEGGPVAPDGKTAIVCDLPASERKKNIASKGLGCCLAADTLVNVKDGSAIEIKDLDPKKHAIFYLDKDGRRRTTNLYEARKTGRVRRLYDLQLEDGRFVRMTGDHRVACHQVPDTEEGGFVAYHEAWLLHRYGGWKGMSFFTIPFDQKADCMAVMRKAISLDPVTVPPTDVWDIQVFEKCYQGEGNFFANGILVHNCVFRSIEYAARWQQVPELYDLPEQMQKDGIPGGGYPDKVKQILAKFGPNVAYIQDTSGDPAILEAILKSGRLPCVTYNGRDGVHYQSTIAHMVCLPYFDRSTNLACVMDNNFTGETQFLWMSCDEFLQRWKGQGGGWVVALLSPPPPPPPHN